MYFATLSGEYYVTASAMYFMGSIIIKFLILSHEGPAYVLYHIPCTRSWYGRAQERVILRVKNLK